MVIHRKYASYKQLINRSLIVTNRLFKTIHRLMRVPALLLFYLVIDSRPTRICNQLDNRFATAPAVARIDGAGIAWRKVFCCINK